MFQNFRLIFRQIRRNSFFSILKVGGLIIGFSVFLVLLQIVRVALERYYQGELQIQSARNYRGMSGLLMLEFHEDGHKELYDLSDDPA